MCGICLILSSSVDHISEKVKEYGLNYFLTARGPDLFNSDIIEFPVDKKVIGLFQGCVLWLQGSEPQMQPISNLEKSTFLWNGDDLALNRDRNVNDTAAIFNSLCSKSEEEVVHFLTNIEGPWSCIYYDSACMKVFFGRDILGRRSLLWSPPDNESDTFILTSTANRGSRLQEVPALGIFVIDLKHFYDGNKYLSLYQYKSCECDELDKYPFLNKINIFESKFSPIRVLNKQLPSLEMIDQLRKFPQTLDTIHLNFMIDFFNDEIKLFSEFFLNSMRKRILASPPKCKNCTTSLNSCLHSKFAVMFSGGLDSTIIAYFLDSCLPEMEPIDLLNVSFEIKTSLEKSGKRDKLYLSKGVQETNFRSPDRESGIKSWNQLCDLFPKRKWNFIEINITADELQKERDVVISDLIAPLTSVLDDSIGCALYFCGRGEGFLHGEQYQSPARVLFSGLGADEQLAGYSRHRGKFESAGWEGLLKEVELEMKRIPYRNLGRDDRVLSHHGRTVRFPFLDEELISYLNSLHIWKKSNLYLPRGVGEKLLLRVIAASIGLSEASVLPKRAIQFGSRIAKLENRKEKGGDSCQRL